MCANDAFRCLRVEMDEFVRFHAWLPVRAEGEVRRRSEEDARRGVVDGVRRKRDDLRMQVVVLTCRVDGLRRQLEVLGDSHEDDGDGSHVRM